MGALEAFYALGDGGIFQTREKISWQYLIYGKPYAIFMATAYVLINCELGSEEPIIKQLKSLDNSWSTRSTRYFYGAYDDFYSSCKDINQIRWKNLRETIHGRSVNRQNPLNAIHTDAIEGQT